MPPDKGNQGTGNQFSSEEKSQGKEEVFLDLLGEVISRLWCHGAVEELPREEVRRALLGWWGRACFSIVSKCCSL